MTLTLESYDSPVENAWCPGCGNFGILKAVKQTLFELEIAPEQAVICTGIGQAPKLPHYMRVHTFNGLHGREVAAAQGIKLAANDLVVIVHGGEGGIYGEGGNHLLHAIRRNCDITVVVHDNKTYGLTKGQPSPTSALGTITAVSPFGVLANPLNPLALAISQDCSFVAQAMSARTEHLVSILKQAILHKGFSLVNVLQPCVTWDKVHTYQYYREHCYEIGDEHNRRDRSAALALALGETAHIPLGVFYENQREPYDQIVLRGVKHPLRERGVETDRLFKLLQRFVG